jgi:hypothetical protein
MSIDRIFVLIFVCLGFSNLSEQNVSEAARIISAELEKAIQNKNVNYILIKRTCHGKQICPLSMQRAFCIFALLDKALGGNGLLDQKEASFSRAESIPFDGDLKASYEAQNTAEEARKINVFFAVLSHDPIVLNSQKWPFVVFNEMFFSSQIPLDSKSVQELLYHCYILTRKHKNLIICINFLHAFNNTDRPCWLPDNFSLLPLDPEYINMGAPNELLTNPDSGTQNHLANYSLMVWNGEVISCYRKTTYCEENDAFIKRKKYAYEFGDWKSYKPFILSADASRGLILHHQLSQLFNDDCGKRIVTRICADSIFMPSLEIFERLLLLPANGCPTNTEFWIHKMQRNTVGCLVDAEKQTPYFFANGKIESPTNGNETFKKYTCNCGECMVHRYLEGSLNCEIYFKDGGR